jgi:phosphoribosyl 1,2-cyclic phosphodiesterase
MHKRCVRVLSSGSCGNSIHVSGDDADVLIDAGISCKELERRMSLMGADPGRVKAVLLTHEHTDHTRGVRRFCSTHSVPVYATSGTLALTPHEGVAHRSIVPATSFNIEGLTVTPFSINHMAADPVAFSVTFDGVKVSIASDLGCVTPAIVREMSSASLLLVEANYDDRMLMGGRYPEFLKQSIKGEQGHLSNDDSGRLSAEAVGESTRQVVLLHISRENNTPHKAESAVRSALRRAGKKVPVSPTDHGGMNGPIDLP